MVAFFSNPLLVIAALLTLALLVNLLLPTRFVAISRYVALTASILALLLGITLCLAFDKSDIGFQFANDLNYVHEYNLSFSLGVDGLSVIFLLLSLFIFPILYLSA